MPRPHVLLVEDDPALVLLMEDLLTDAGYQVSNWPRFAGAAAYIQQTQPDLVVLDLWLEEPGDGWRILAAVRQDGATRALPMILCTADGHAAEAHALVQTDPHCRLLPKPFAIATFLALVRTALRHP
jgi:DNA-binding response OmpR family regulator